MDTPIAAYLAGLLDGEGSFMIMKSNAGGFERWEAKISMATTDDLLAWWCKDNVNGYVSGPIQPRSPNAQPSWRWELKGKAVGPTIEAIWPYLVLKRPQAALLWRLRSRIKPGARAGSKGVVAMDEGERYERETMRLACRALNHRGTEPLPEEQALALGSAEMLDLMRPPHQAKWGRLPAPQPSPG